MENIVQLQKRLWEAADELRANSKLTSTEYYMPILGLIFLRHAFNRFLKVEQAVKQTLPSRGGVVRPLAKDDFVRQGALFLQEQARYDYLLNLPQDQGKGQAVVKAMELIEADYEALKGVLPKEYQIFEDDVLTRLLKIFNDEALNEANGDVFGRIYEYFLMNFAIEGAQDKGEFFTPVALELFSRYTVRASRRWRWCRPSSISSSLITARCLIRPAVPAACLYRPAIFCRTAAKRHRNSSRSTGRKKRRQPFVWLK